MEKFVPYQKLSKRKRRERDKQRRSDWGNMNPITRKPANPKAYNRKKTPYGSDPSDTGFFFLNALSLFYFAVFRNKERTVV